MSTKMKAFVTSIIALAGVLFAAYVAFSDGDDTTKVDTDKVISAAKDALVAGQEAFADDEETTATESTATETADTTAATTITDTPVDESPAIE